jgi:hypothetical protein
MARRRSTGREWKGLEESVASAAGGSALISTGVRREISVHCRGRGGDRVFAVASGHPPEQGARVELHLSFFLSAPSPAAAVPSGRLGVSQRRPNPNWTATSSTVAAADGNASDETGQVQRGREGSSE